MMLAIRRLKSENKKDFWFGIKNIVYDVASIISLALLSISIFKEPFCLLNIFLIALFISFSFAAFLTSDYKKIKNVHKGSLNYYMHEINMPNDIFIKDPKTFKDIGSNLFSNVCFIVILSNILIFWGFLLSGKLSYLMFYLFNKDFNVFQLSITAFIFSIWTCFNFDLFSTVMSGRIKRISFSQEDIKKYLDIEDIDNDEKEAFMKYAKNLIKNNDNVTKKDVFEWTLRTKRVLEERKKYEELREEAKPVSKKLHPYQDIIDYETLNK